MFAVASTGEVIRTIAVDHQQTGSYGLAVSPNGETAVFPASDPGPYNAPTTSWSIELSTGRTTRIAIDDGEEVQDHPIFINAHHIVFGAGRLTASAGGPNGGSAPWTSHQASSPG
jgi:hypothetical protein